MGGLLTPSESVIVNLQPSGDVIAVATSDPAFGLVDGNRQIRLWKTNVAPDMRGKVGDAFTIAPNARQVRFGLGYQGDEPVLFDLAQATITGMPDLLPGFARPLVSLVIEGWENQYHPTFAGRPLQLWPNEIARSLAIRSDGTGFVLGTEFFLRTFDVRGRQLWAQQGPGIAYGVNLSRPDHRRGLCRRHNPLAPLVGRQGAPRSVRRPQDQRLGGLDAQRLLYGLAGR
jgi:hypothetical protein